MDSLHTEPKSPDQILVEALLSKDRKVTQEFLYRKCWPLFKSVYDNYYTDCESCVEFINEIYIYLLTPEKETGTPKLASFGFRSSLFTWLKTVCIFYCYKRFKRKGRAEINNFFENVDDVGVRYLPETDSINHNDSIFAGHDAETILGLMPNRRYSNLIRLRYLEEHTNEETAALMGMNMNTYYSKHKLAKDQFVKTLRKEERSLYDNR